MKICGTQAALLLSNTLVSVVGPCLYSPFIQSRKTFRRNLSVGDTALCHQASASSFQYYFDLFSPDEFVEEGFLCNI
jgi:hypothetical protein